MWWTLAACVTTRPVAPGVLDAHSGEATGDTAPAPGAHSGPGGRHSGDGHSAVGGETTGTYPYLPRGTGRVYLVRWPPASGVIEQDAHATITGWPESQLGEVLLRIPDTDGDGADELYAYASNASRAVIAPVEAVASGDAAAAALQQVSIAGAWGAVGDFTGDGIADLSQPFGSRSETLAVIDGARLGDGQAIGVSDAVVTIGVGASAFGGYGSPSRAVGDLDGLPGEELWVGHQTWTSGGGRDHGRTDLWTGAELDGAAPRTIAEAHGTVEGRWANSPKVGAVGVLPDVTGDGVPELLTTQPQGDVGGVDNSGEVVVMDGARMLSGGAWFFDDAFVRVGGDAQGDEVGRDLFGLPDLDGDGLGELVVSSEDAVWVLRGADLARGGIVRVSAAAASASGFSEPELLPDLDADGVPEVGAWGPAGFVVWSGGALLAAPGGDLAAAPTLAPPCQFRDRGGWGPYSTIGVAFVRDAGGWIAAFGASGAL